jgi:hypothetical protein
MGLFVDLENPNILKSRNSITMHPHQCKILSAANNLDV